MKLDDLNDINSLKASLDKHERMLNSINNFGINRLSLDGTYLNQYISEDLMRVFLITCLEEKINSIKMALRELGVDIEIIEKEDRTLDQIQAENSLILTTWMNALEGKVQPRVNFLQSLFLATRQAVEKARKFDNMEALASAKES